MSYAAPLRDMQFVLHELAGFDEIVKLPGNEELSAELVEQILEENAKFAAGVLDPLNRPGDVEGARWEAGGKVTTPDGYKDAYRQFWKTAGRRCVARRIRRPERAARSSPRRSMEMWNASNLAFTLCPMLTQGAVEAILHCGSDAQKQSYPPEDGQRRVDRHHEPHRAPGRHRSGASHAPADAARTTLPYLRPEDLHHLRRARPDREHRAPGAGAQPGAPEGVRGHLAVHRAEVPGERRRQPGARNDVRCVSIEHKLGIHGSPTA